MNSLPPNSLAETGLADAIVREAFAIDAACEAAWNVMNCDGWSWREMRNGEAGNSERERALGAAQAEEMEAAIAAAIAAYKVQFQPSSSTGTQTQ